MLNDFLFLWRNREKPATSSRLFKVWSKRLYHLYGTSCLLARPALLRFRGASVGRLAVVGKAIIGGRVSNLIIGNEASLGRCKIALHDKVTIGRCAVINDGVTLLTASHSLTDPQWGRKEAPIVIGDFAWIATNAMVLPGVRIGTGAVVGAGAVVREDVPDHAVVAGNPAAQMPTRRTADLSYSPVMLNAPFEAWVGPKFEGRKNGDVT